MVFMWIMFLVIRAPPKSAYDNPPREGEDEEEPERAKLSRRVFGT